jgi:hypothetical protein
MRSFVPRHIRPSRRDTILKFETELFLLFSIVRNQPTSRLLLFDCSRIHFHSSQRPRGRGRHNAPYFTTASKPHNPRPYITQLTVEDYKRTDDENQRDSGSRTRINIVMFSTEKRPHLVVKTANEFES